MSQIRAFDVDFKFELVLFAFVSFTFVLFTSAFVYIINPQCAKIKYIEIDQPYELLHNGN